MAKFEVGDVVRSKGTCVTYLVTFVDEYGYYFKAFDKSLRATGLVRVMFGKEKYYALVDKQSDKMKERDFKQGDICIVVNNSGKVKADMVEQKVVFVSYLDTPIPNTLPADCTVVGTDKKARFMNAVDLVKCSAPKEKEETSTPFIILTSKDREIILQRNMDNGKQAVFVARQNPKDIYNEETGVLVALARAYNDPQLERFAVNRYEFTNLENKLKAIKKALA